MKDDNLKSAIENLPEFEAPDVWDGIENGIKYKRVKYIFVGLSILILVLSGGFAIEKFVLEINDYSSIDNFYVKNNLYGLSDVHIHDTNSDFSFQTSEGTDLRNDFIQNYEGNNELISRVDNSVELEIEIDKTIHESDIENFSDNFNSLFKIETVVIRDEKGGNLVRNPGFEDHRACPSGINGRKSRKLLPDWFVPNRGTPDYFHVCGAKDAGVPDNFAGSIKPHSGQAYAGIILRENFTRDNKITGEKPEIYREYLQNELINELEKGKTYKIQFYVCNSSNSRFAVDGVGACLTVENEWVNHKEVMELVPVVENPVGNILMNQNYWVAIEGFFTAQGGEKYLTIGNFKNNFSTNYMMQNNATAFNYSYYYIDDVSVIEVEERVETKLINSNNSEVTNLQTDEIAQERTGDW
ncbi:MAG: hypothetical protein JXR36_05235, partial [Bacteroidales bacterium]|nr:hypothetical protein [Bacteroidales bacterium]